ncbi:hypothetical protein ACIQVL_04970 [Streptomyces sp. NPDC090499]|uniref:hypothetical protein n=1 Tax=Streptomyces sp. NPDC090499 TaxID=3365965 RepID=UPI00380E7189
MNSTDLQTQILTAARAHLSARTGWDEMPELLVIKRHGDTGLSVRPLPISPLLWEFFSPNEVIVASARATRTKTIAAEADTVALALRVEGFAITPGTSPEADEALRRIAGGSTPSIKDIPGRIEQRWLHAVDRYGQQYLVTADRQSDGSAGPAVGRALDGGQQFLGVIQKALDVFCRTVWPRSAAAAPLRRTGERP